MQARGLLMKEHRLIERIMVLIEEALKQIEENDEVDLSFIDKTVDFMSTYVERTHHEKEEDIFFRDLKKKDLSDEHRLLTNELINEHDFERKVTNELFEASTRFQAGEGPALAVIVEKLRTLVNLFSKHIEKEDNVIFPSSRAYFSDEEDQIMLEEFLEFDSKIIHEKYTSIIEALESQ